MEKMKKSFILMTLVILAFQLSAVRISTAFASSPLDVVINEVAWAGTSDNSNDEWIELYNNTSSPIDLSGWTIIDDETTTYTIVSGTIPARGYFLIEDSEETVSDIGADAVIGLSLANTGDSLVLKNPQGNIIDAVNSSGAAWYAGDSTTKASMERINPLISGDISANWGSAISGNSTHGRDQTPILGTPKSVNSVYEGTGFIVSISPKEISVLNGERFTISIEVDQSEDLFSYGLDLIYNPALLKFVSANEGGFLSSDGSATAFLYALENGAEGKLVVGGSRLQSEISGVSGGGELFEATFDVVGNTESDQYISFSEQSFLTDSFGEVQAIFIPAKFSENSGTTSMVENPIVALGEEIYSLKVSWSPPQAGADSYIISREMPNKSFVNLGETSNLFFEDSLGIMPETEYSYRIVAIKNGIPSQPASVVGTESRGLKGDIDKSKRVDGKDIDLLARSYGKIYGESAYSISADTNYDGKIDGSDLINIGASFALTCD